MNTILLNWNFHRMYYGSILFGDRFEMSKEFYEEFFHSRRTFRLLKLSTEKSPL